MTNSDFLSVREICVGYGGWPVLNDITLSIAKGEFVALLGASGCGKTTLLRTIAGFIHPSQGSILVDGKDITAAPPDKRGMALMFQSYALWPHMTAAQNIAYGLKLRRASKAQIAARIDEMASLLGLEGLLTRKPGQLSGGQKQRVALGRALAVSPDILLLDEPLSNLDARIRLSVRHEIRALQQRLGITAIHVTHDREEAMVMADRIVILHAGRIAQTGAPHEVYNAPVSSFVAAFMGAENSLQLAGRRRGDFYEISAGPMNAVSQVPLAGRDLPEGAVEARFRPDEANLHPEYTDPIPGSLMLKGEVTAVSYPGGHWRHALRLSGGEVLVDAPGAFEPGSSVAVEVPASALFLFPIATAGARNSAPAAAAGPRSSAAAAARPKQDVSA